MNKVFLFHWQYFVVPKERVNEIKYIDAGTAQQVFEWGGGEAKLDEFFFGGGGRGNAWEFLFNSSKATENAFITIKLLIFFHIFSDVAIGSQSSPSLN